MYMSQVPPPLGTPLHLTTKEMETTDEAAEGLEWDELEATAADTFTSDVF